MLTLSEYQWDIAAVSLLKVHTALYELGFNVELEGLATKLTTWLSENDEPDGEFVDRVTVMGVDVAPGVN